MKTLLTFLSRLTLLSLLTVGAAAQDSAPPADGSSSDPLAAGRAATRSFYRREIASVWARMTPQMQQALGGEKGLSGFRDKVDRQLGRETEVLSEEVRRVQGFDVYQRLAHFEKIAGPVMVQWAFDGEGKVAGFFIRPVPHPAPSKYQDYVTKTPLRLPFEGEWTVVWGGRTTTDNYHAISVDQRFAYDFLIERGEGAQRGDAQRATHRGDGSSLDQYYCWDRPILAPAAGVVTEAVDGLPDQKPGVMDPGHPAGNHVVLDHGNGEFSVLAHLRSGSVAVAEGDEVERGQTLGRCGNSGNTTEPHLHYHLQTADHFGAGEGLPAQFEGYVADGEPVERGEPRRGQVIQPAAPESGKTPPGETGAAP